MPPRLDTSETRRLTLTDKTFTQENKTRRGVCPPPEVRPCRSGGSCFERIPFEPVKDVWAYRPHAVWCPTRHAEGGCSLADTHRLVGVTATPLPYLAPCIPRIPSAHCSYFQPLLSPGTRAAQRPLAASPAKLYRLLSTPPLRLSFLKAQAAPSPQRPGLSLFSKGLALANLSSSLPVLSDLSLF